VCWESLDGTGVFQDQQAGKIVEHAAARVRQMIDEPSMDEQEARRLAENERFKIWEEGFMAGLHTSDDVHRMNPYQWHGLGFVPDEADLDDIRVRVFLGMREITVAAIGPITRDRHGTRIDQVLIHPKPGSR
jgi:hypothetical protein